MVKEHKVTVKVRRPASYITAKSGHGRLVPSALKLTGPKKSHIKKPKALRGRP